MFWDTLKKYFRENIIAVTVLIVFLLVGYFFKFGKENLYIFFGLFLFEFIRGYFRYKKRLLYLAELESKGLTEDDASDITFVEKWEKIRAKGVYFYCLFESGLGLSIYFSFLFGIIGYILVYVIPPKMNVDATAFVVTCCFMGIIAGILAGAFSWSVNQKKFFRLTNPSH